MESTTTASARRTRQRGTTLIEACTVIAIAGIVASLSIPGMKGLIDGRRLDGVATQLATDIQFVRTEAVARNAPVRLSFQPTAVGSCYVVHTGSAAQCSCAADAVGPTACSGGALPIKTVHLRAADTVELRSNVGSILFDPLHGTSTPTGTLRVIGAAEREVRHIVNIMGRVRSCSPLGAASGYRAC